MQIGSVVWKEFLHIHTYTHTYTRNWSQYTRNAQYQTCFATKPASQVLTNQTKLTLTVTLTLTDTVTVIFYARSLTPTKRLYRKPLFLIYPTKKPSFNDKVWTYYRVLVSKRRTGKKSTFLWESIFSRFLTFYAFPQKNAIKYER